MKPISRLRFDALAGYSKKPFFNLLFEEIEWYEEGEERVLGLLGMDVTDQDYGSIIIAQDRKGRYRAVHVTDFADSLEEARNTLQQELVRQAGLPDEEFYQGDEQGRPVDFFRPLVARESLNGSFRLLLESPGYSPARGIVSAMMRYFEDPDGNFIQQFQTTGFDTRIWELYLFAALSEMGFAVDRAHNAPDFLCRSISEELAIEAVTVNPTVAGGVNVEPPEPREPDERASYLANYMPIKFSNVLTGKLAREYWRLPHVEGKPLVIAIQDFHTGDAMMGTNSALTRYLYGLNVTWHRDIDGNLVLEQEIIENHEWQGRVRASGFFRLPTSEYISAVIANPHGTISKFNRMGYLAGFGSREVRMIRRGTHYVDDPNMDEPAYFEREVTGPGYAETWREGMIIYHNPAALFPLDLDSFPGVAHMVIDEDGSLTTLMPREGFHPFMSYTAIFAPAD